MDVKQKVMEAHEIRAELARRKWSKRRFADETGISYQYLVQILNGYFKATRMRTIMTQHLFPENQSNEHNQ
ncbi:MAG: helix-turn-helix transcriptional regulator [Candidatus Cloacimonetes bacterium]|nr:helix-turn-helix transcriptional regulator [Candidatus Cloacimonadota bacterium]